MDDLESIEGLHLKGISVMSTGVKLTVPPGRVRDVQKLLALEASGFIPSGAVHFDPDEQAFVLQLDGDGASHMLDLLSIAMDDRDAETWAERLERSRSQLALQLGIVADPNAR